MKILYLGTAAAEGLPAPFCTCAICENARVRRGREVRSRSQMLIDGELLIDFPPDTYYHALTHDLRLGGVHTLLVTHDHMDHWFPAGLINRHSAYQKGATGVLHVYGNEAVGRSFERHFSSALYSAQPIGEFVQFHAIHGGERVRRCGWEITAVPADHDWLQECLIYICKKDGKTLLYAHDTGLRLRDAAWELLAAGRYDLVSVDATMGLESCPYNHMGIPDAERFFAKLSELGCIDERTLCVCSHFSHNGGLTHEALTRRAKRWLPAYDGMEVEF